MNKPATKEPSMDEILSSIRQIIADDDAAVAPPPARPPVTVAPTPTPKPVPAAPSPRAVAPEPFALSPAQIVKPEPEPEPAPDFSAMLGGVAEAVGDDIDPMEEMLAREAELIDPEDVAFEVEPEPEPEPEPIAPPPAPLMRAEPPPRDAEPPRAAEPKAPPRPPVSVAQAAPLPDPTLSSDMAEELLAPATDAAVQSSISRLSAINRMGIGSQTVEGMMRDLLRPMLKDWLDENLPALVERMVEKEIGRISRGVK